MPGLSVLHYLLELVQTHVHWFGDAIQSSCVLCLLCVSSHANERAASFLVCFTTVHPAPRTLLNTYLTQQILNSAIKKLI